MTNEIDPNFFLNVAKIYVKVFKLTKEEIDTVYKFAMYIDKELNKEGNKGGEGKIIL